MSSRFFCLVCVLCLVGCSQQTPQEPIVIGNLAPLSGPDKIAGEHVVQGMQIAVEELNQPEHLIAGRQIAVLHADTKSDPETIQAEAVRLITVNRAIALIGGGNQAEAERLGRTVQPYDLSLISQATLPSKLVIPNVFSLTPALGTYGTLLARYAVKELRANPIAILRDSRLSAAGPFIESFVEDLKREPSLSVTSWDFNSEAELMALAEPLNKFKPRAVLYSGAVPDLTHFRALLKDVQPAWLFASSSDGPVAPAEPGLTRISVLPPDDASPFTRAYDTRYQESPDVAALLTYDAVRICAEGLRRAPKNAPSKLREELLRSDPPFPCSTGALTFDVEQKARRPLFVVQAKNGKPVLLKRYEADPQ
jgi:ABC-type branched-subunit amino acid transport system substrate-binding protein